MENNDGLFDVRTPSLPPEPILPEPVELPETVEYAAPPPSDIVINNGDDMSDMFKPPSWNDEDMRADDLLGLDHDEDVMDYDEDGSFDSLLTVDNEDILGDDFPGGNHNDIPSGKAKYRRTRKPYIPPRNPYSSLGGMR